jgi:6-phosphogluconolactonase
MVPEIVTDPQAIAARAADLFLRRMRTAVRTSGRFSVALSGGRTPRATYAEIAARAGREPLPWDRTHLFWGDERCVPAGDPRSNERMARETLLERVPAPTANIHPMRCGGDPAAAASACEAALRLHFGADPRFDLILLGMGPDGHTASLFPASPLLAAGVSHWVGWDRRPGEAFDRLTLTLAVINRAACVVFLVSGAEKAATLRRLLTGQGGDLPAARVRPEGELHWLVDAAAARLLPSP